MSNCYYEESQVSEVSMIPLNQKRKKDSKNAKIRYLLKVRLKDSIGGRSACVIMSNPSKAKAPKKSGESDKSVNKVIQGIYQQNSRSDSKIDKIEYIYILNLLPFYSTNQSDLIEELEVSQHSYFNVIHKNLNFVKKIAKRTDYIILAWGGQTGLLNHYLNKLKADFLQYIKNCDNIYVFYKPLKDNKNSTSLFTQENNPRHPSRGSDIEDIRKINVTPLLSLKEISSS